MHSSKRFMVNDPRNDDSIFERPRVALLDEKHWSYVQRRYHLTARELQVAKLVCQGFNNGEVTGVLQVKHGTVKTHLRNIYRKVRVTNKIGMLLKFVDDVNKFSAKSEIIPAIPIVDTEKTEKKAPTPSDIPQKK